LAALEKNSFLFLIISIYLTNVFFRFLELDFFCSYLNLIAVVFLLAGAAFFELRRRAFGNQLKNKKKTHTGIGERERGREEERPGERERKSGDVSARHVCRLSLSFWSFLFLLLRWRKRERES